MDLNTLANIAAIKQLKLEVLKNIKSQYMKESNTRANIANCNYKATQKGNLKEHQKSVHDGRKYHCNHCSYQATTNGNLKEH